MATNALLERRGARVALVTTEGFADVIEIARPDRPSLYDPFADRPAPLVPRELRLEVRERIGPHGEVIVPLDSDSLAAIPDGVEVVAVCLLHADLAPRHEEMVAAELARRGFAVSVSSQVSPEFREYERTLTTVVDAYLQPSCRGYLEALAPLAGEVFVMTSAGGLVPLAAAADRPAALLLSGPAGGGPRGRAGGGRGRFSGCGRVRHGRHEHRCVSGAGWDTAARARPGGRRLPDPLAVPRHPHDRRRRRIDRIDAGGALLVGPESAGASPGPACYGLDGAAPTVTDADLVLGRVPLDAAFPGIDRLDVRAAQRALDAAGVPASGVVEAGDVIRMLTPGGGGWGQA